MYNKLPHRNSQKRFYGEDKIYFIVTKTYKNHPYFQESIFCDLLIEELKMCKSMKKFKLYAFSIIYDHLNLLIKPGEEYNISMVMKSLKENLSRDINYIILNNFNEGDTSTCRLHLRELLINYQKIFVQKYGNPQFKIPQFKWQKSFHDHVIRNEKDYINHHNYTIYNHLKHKLPENWKYTSLNFPEMVDNFFE
ncbi:MAG: transposase [Patescibacteria group bacterium]